MVLIIKKSCAWGDKGSEINKSDNEVYEFLTGKKELPEDVNVKNVDGFDSCFEVKGGITPENKIMTNADLENKSFTS